MRTTALNAIAFGALLVAPFRLPAQQERQARTAGRFPHYLIEDLGTLGGPYSFSYNLNNTGVLSGGSATATQNGDLPKVS